MPFLEEFAPALSLSTATTGSLVLAFPGGVTIDDPGAGRITGTPGDSSGL